MPERDLRQGEVRLDESAGLRNRHVRMDVDGGALWPDRTAGLAVLAGGGDVVFVPLRRHCDSMVEARGSCQKANSTFLPPYSLIRLIRTRQDAERSWRR